MITREDKPFDQKLDEILSNLSPGLCMDSRHNGWSEDADQAKQQIKDALREAVGADKDITSGNSMAVTIERNYVQGGNHEKQRIRKELGL